VLIEGEADFRRSPEDSGSFDVRGHDGLMIPLGTLVSTSPKSGPDTISSCCCGSVTPSRNPNGEIVSRVSRPQRTCHLTVRQARENLTT
jgi:hypothetical protein